jgi:DNA polymerase bacteriophage-type
MQHHPFLLLPRLLIDFETFSHQDVREVGAFRYAEDETTEILCMGWKFVSGPHAGKEGMWFPSQPLPQEILDHIAAGFVMEAHNCAFERAVWHFKMTKLMGLPMANKWADTMAVCAYRSLPLGLDKVGDVIDLPLKKDKNGKSLLSKLSQPRKPTKKNPETRNKDPELLFELYDYCLGDVRSEESLGIAIGDLPADEYSVWALDQRINTRGVMVDMPAVLGALTIVDKLTTRLEAELVAITGGAVQTAGQRDKLIEWCAANGLSSLPNLQAGTVEDMLAMDWIPENVRRALEIRQQLSKASAKKLLKFRDCANLDMRIRGLLQYHGAGTGRWAGRLVQPQNFPRGSVKVKGMKGGEVMELLIEVIKTGNPDLLELHFGDPMAAVASALRGMFVAAPGKVFYVADFSAIEARVVMWLAGQIDALDAFHKYDNKLGPDIYCVMAAKIYLRAIDKDKDPDERQLGKITILGCGYQMSGARLQEQARDAYGVEIDLETANKLVAIFRSTYDKVPALWRGLEDAAIQAVVRQGKTEYVSPNGVKIGFEFVQDKAGRWLAMILPNKRKLWYFNPGTEMKTITYLDKETGDPKTFEKRSLYYEGRDNKKGGGWGRVYSYGGMLTENAVQAISRDLMVAAMFRCEKANFPVVLSVHDELVSEAPDGREVKEFEAIVAGPVPEWAAGCPVSAEGWKGKRYRK